jgi:pyruvate-ferredoxin/flavodoxin oxidoreductase
MAETRPRRGAPAFAHAIEAATAAERMCVQHLAEEKTDGARALAACEKVAAEGGRAAAIMSLAALVDARRTLVALVERRRPIVIHAVASFPGEDRGVAAHADLHALGDVGVGIVVARDAQDAADLVVIAHRAAEDAETPIVVFHDGYPSSFARDRVVLPDAPLVRAALEPAAPRAAASDTGLAPHRRAAARVPFALASAMRAFERYSGRKIDPVEVSHVEGADVVLIASGAIAESARALVEDQRARGGEQHPLGIVQLVALRPFPGPDLVRAVGRARAVAVVERVDAPLFQSSPLALEVKAAFADALTWAPGYPGIGRIPTIFSACIDPSRNEASPGEILAVVENAIQGEHGRRTFRVGDGHVARAEERRVHSTDARSIRWHGDPALAVHLLSDLYGGHARATPRGEDTWDVTVGPTQIRAHHGASELDAVVLTRSDADLEALSALREGGLALVAGDAAKLSSAMQAELRAKRARVIGVDGKHAASLVGAIAAALPPAGFDRTQAIAEAERSLRAGAPSSSDSDVRTILDAFARGFDAA